MLKELITHEASDNKIRVKNTIYMVKWMFYVHNQNKNKSNNIYKIKCAGVNRCSVKLHNQMVAST